jgi:hypothetical protein
MEYIKTQNETNKEKINKIFYNIDDILKKLDKQSKIEQKFNDQQLKKFLAYSEEKKNLQEQFNQIINPQIQFMFGQPRPSGLLVTFNKDDPKFKKDIVNFIASLKKLDTDNDLLYCAKIIYTICCRIIKNYVQTEPFPAYPNDLIEIQKLYENETQLSIQNELDKIKKEKVSPGEIIASLKKILEILIPNEINNTHL